MLAQVTAKFVGDVFLRRSVYMYMRFEPHRILRTKHPYIPLAPIGFLIQSPRYVPHLSHTDSEDRTTLRTTLLIF